MGRQVFDDEEGSPFERELLALCAELIGADSEKAVRERTREAFARAGLVARFWKDGAENTLTIDVNEARRALSSHKPVFTGPISAEPDAVYVPLDGAEVLHVVGRNLTVRQSYAFGFFAKLFSTALLDVQASEAARRKLSDTQLMLQLARTSSETLDLDVVMGHTADSLVQILDVSSCFILLYDEAAKCLRGGASSEARRALVDTISIPIDDPNSIAALAARERRTIAIGDTSVDPVARRAPLVAAFRETAVAGVPIFVRNRLEGVVMLDDTRGPRSFSPEWMELATAMVAQVGLSIANARLFESLRKSYAEVDATRAEMVKRERLAGLGELAAIVAHEVRNPLGVIYNATTSIKRHLDGSADGETLVAIVREECERLNQIVGDLLDFARPRQLATQPEDVGRVLAEVAEALSVQQPTVRFEVACDPDLAPAMIDRRLIRQALLNVGLNAAQAMQHGGVVRLAATHATGALILAISDDGPGIAAGDLPRIFEPFFTTKASGAGLGLAVVKRIIEDHGGEVSVESSSTHGTTFTFRFGAW